MPDKSGRIIDVYKSQPITHVEELPMEIQDNPPVDRPWVKHVSKLGAIGLASTLLLSTFTGSPEARANEPENPIIRPAAVSIGRAALTATPTIEHIKSYEKESDTKPTSIKVATYNILGSIYDKHPNVSGSVKSRASQASREIKKNDLSVVGLQELSRHKGQYGYFKKKLSDKFDNFPSKYVHKGDASQNTIFWKQNTFKKEKSGFIKIPWYTDKKLQRSGRTPWVILKNKDTEARQMYVNTHLVALNQMPGSDPGGAQKRKRSARIIKKSVNKIVRNFPGRKHLASVVLTGDFNSAFNIRKPKKVSKGDYRWRDKALKGDRNALPYCILTSGNDFDSAYDLKNGKDGKCPTKKGSSIDHIFLKKLRGKMSVKRQYRVKNNRASDHDMLVAEIRTSS